MEIQKDTKTNNQEIQNYIITFFSNNPTGEVFKCLKAVTQKFQIPIQETYHYIADYLHKCWKY